MARRLLSYTHSPWASLHPKYSSTHIRLSLTQLRLRKLDKRAKSAKPVGLILPFLDGTKTFTQACLGF